MKRKDIYLTVLSILFVIAIFVFQAILVRRLYDSTMNVLRREMNVAIEEAYSFDLGIRMAIRRSQSDQPNTSRFLGLKADAKSQIDTTKVKVHKINGRMASQELKDDYVTFMRVGMEQYISNYYPPEVIRMDSLVDSVLVRHNLELDYCVLLVDTGTNKIEQISKPNFDVSGALLVSKDVPLNFEQSKVMRLVANPTSKFFKQMDWMLILSLALSLFCIYCLYHQLRSLARQRSLMRLKNDFFSDVSHEFKQPLTVLSQAMSALKNEKTLYNPEKLGKVIAIAQSEITRLNDKTEMVLTMAKQDEGIFDLKNESFNLVELVYSLSDEAITVPIKLVEIEILNELGDPFIYGDKMHVDQIVSNLINNAVKYSNESVTIKIKLYRDPQNIFISVVDNGFGISEENQKIIFDRYSRVNNGGAIKGHGIGLNYIKRIIEIHGGSITLISELGKGSEFIVRLPQPNKD